MAEMIPFGKDEPERSSARLRDDVRSYSNEEVSEIIRVALRSTEESRTNTVGYDEMLTIARDFGLTPGDIARAFDEINAKREVERTESKAVLSLKIHAMIFAAVNAGLFAINWLTGPDVLWALYPFVSWGTLLLLHAILVKYTPRAIGHLLMQAEAEFSETPLASPSADHTVRFTSPDQYHGLAQCSGILQIRDDELLIEYETKDTVLNIWRSGVREVMVPIRDISQVRLERQFWNSRIILVSQRLKSFEGIPGHNGGQVKLTLDKDSRAAGERLVRELTNRIADS